MDEQRVSSLVKRMELDGEAPVMALSVKHLFDDLKRARREDIEKMKSSFSLTIQRERQYASDDARFAMIQDL